MVVNVVIGRNAPPKSRSAGKKDAKVLEVKLDNNKLYPKELFKISFGSGDYWCDDLPEDPPMVITGRIGTGLVKRILVDTRADSNIFRNMFDALGFKESNLKDYHHGVVGLGDNYIKPDSSVVLRICVGFGSSRKSAMVEFVLLRDSMAYNIILGRRTINELLAVIYTKFLTMKFVPNNESVGMIRGDLKMIVACDNASLTLRKKFKEAPRVILAYLDARIDKHPRPKPQGNLEKFWVRKAEDKFTFVNHNLPHELKGPLIEVIRANGDLFTWTPADMQGIDPDFM